MADGSDDSLADVLDGDRSALTKRVAVGMKRAATTFL